MVSCGAAAVGDGAAAAAAAGAAGALLSEATVWGVVSAACDAVRSTLLCAVIAATAAAVPATVAAAGNALSPNGGASPKALSSNPPLTRPAMSAAATAGCAGAVAVHGCAAGGTLLAAAGAAKASPSSSNVIHPADGASAAVAGAASASAACAPLGTGAAATAAVTAVAAAAAVATAAAAAPDAACVSGVVSGCWSEAKDASTWPLSTITHESAPASSPSLAADGVLCCRPGWSDVAVGSAATHAAVACAASAGAAAAGASTVCSSPDLACACDVGVAGAVPNSEEAMTTDAGTCVVLSMPETFLAALAKLPDSSRTDDRPVPVRVAREGRAGSPTRASKPLDVPDQDVAPGCAWSSDARDDARAAIAAASAAAMPSSRELRLPVVENSSRCHVCSGGDGTRRDCAAERLRREVPELRDSSAPLRTVPSAPPGAATAVAADADHTAPDAARAAVMGYTGAATSSSPDINDAVVGSPNSVDVVCAAASWATAAASAARMVSSRVSVEPLAEAGVSLASVRHEPPCLPMDRGVSELPDRRGMELPAGNSVLGDGCVTAAAAAAVNAGTATAAGMAEPTMLGMPLSGRSCG